MNRIYTVAHDAHDDTTVIASSLEEAIGLAVEYNDEDPELVTEYDGGEQAQQGLRWVGFESPDDAGTQALDLTAVGVDLDRIYRRVTSRWTVDYLWEVGCLDSDWCRLAPGVLCGGDQ